MPRIRFFLFVLLSLVALALLSFPPAAGAAPWALDTDTPTVTETATATLTPPPTDTPAPTATSLYDVDVELPNGAHYQIENRISLGDFAVVLVGALLLLVLVPYVLIKVLRLWI